MICFIRLYSKSLSFRFCLFFVLVGKKFLFRFKYDFVLRSQLKFSVRGRKLRSLPNAMLLLRLKNVLISLKRIRCSLAIVYWYIRQYSLNYFKIIVFLFSLLLGVTFQNAGSLPYTKAAFLVFSSLSLCFLWGTAKPRNELSGLWATKQWPSKLVICSESQQIKATKTGFLSPVRVGLILSLHALPSFENTARVSSDHARVKFCARAVKSINSNKGFPIIRL